MTAQTAAQSKEGFSYTVPAAASSEETPAMLPAARLTSYVFAHSRYSSGLGQNNVLSGLLSEEPSSTQEVGAVNGTAGPGDQPPMNRALAPQPPRDPNIAP